METATVLAIVLTWGSYFVRLLLYATALFATSALVREFAERRRHDKVKVIPTVRKHMGSIFSLGLRALAIYAVFALLFSSLSMYLVRHGHKAALASAWLEDGLGAIVLALLAFLLAPLAVRALSGRYPGKVIARQSQILAFLLGVVSLLLARFVATNLHSVRIESGAVRGILAATGSWIAALPYALIFVVLSMLAIENERLAEVAADTRTE